MFMETLFIIAKTWKQPRCSSVGEWINKLGYIQTIEYYSKLKRSKYQAMKKHGGDINAIIKWKKAIFKGYILSDSNYVTF